MFPKRIVSSCRDRVELTPMAGRDSWAYIVSAFLLIGGLITTFFRIDGISLPLIGAAIAVLGLIVPFLLLLVTRPYFPLAVVKEITVYESGKMKVKGSFLGHEFREKEIPLSHCERRKYGFFLGTSYRNSVFVSFVGLGHEEVEFLDLLSKMTKAKTYPVR